MADRYFVETPVASDQVVLSGPEAHHAAHVLRAAPGEQLVLFDGSGWEYQAEVQQVGRSEVRLLVVSREEIDRELTLSLTLGVSLPKGQRQRWLLEKMVELGVSHFVPLTTQRGVAQPIDKALSRLRRYVIEASKQCGRNRLMEICQPQSWSDFLDDILDNFLDDAGASQGVLRWVADPSGDRSIADASIDLQSAPPPEARMAVGPEGGLTDEEVSAASGRGWSVVNLGSRILRIETAALMLATTVAIAAGKPRE